MMPAPTRRAAVYAPSAGCHNFRLPRRANWTMKRFLPLLAFVTIALVGIIGAAFVWSADQRSKQIRFAALAEEGANRVAEVVGRHMLVIQATAAMFEAKSSWITRAAFKTYFRSLHLPERNPGSVGLGYSVFARRSEWDDLARAYEASNGEPLEIWPAPPRDDFVAVAVMFETWSRARIEPAASTPIPTLPGGRPSTGRSPISSPGRPVPWHCCATGPIRQLLHRLRPGLFGDFRHPAPRRSATGAHRICRRIVPQRRVAAIRPRCRAVSAAQCRRRRCDGVRGATVHLWRGASSRFGAGFTALIRSMWRAGSGI